MNAVIVEDEYLAIKILEQFAQRIPELNIVKTFKDPVKALPYLEAYPPDLLFLDIQMPHLSGFELLKKLGNPPLVIFTTARHEYAVSAFELEVVDYLVKPIAFERFEKSVARAKEILEFRNARHLIPSEYIKVRADHKVHKLQLVELEYLEAYGEYVRIYARGTTLIAHGVLKDFLAQLPREQFLRIHKSYVVSRDKIRSFSGQTVVLTNGKEIPIGRTYKIEFLKRMEH
jgi:DNA-binding LytR/AlgR family response regulator